MNKQEIIKKVEKSGLKFKVVISSASALVMHDIIKETQTDKVECYVRALYYNSLKKELIDQGYEFKYSEIGEGYIEYEGLHIHFNKNVIDNAYIKIDPFIFFALAEDVLKEYEYVRDMYKNKYEKYSAKCALLKSHIEENKNVE